MILILTRASLIPVSLVFGRSNTRKAARLAVYEATMIIANPAQTMPSTRAEKLRGVPRNNNKLSCIKKINLFKFYAIYV
jgi:hypothetical protein